VIKAKSLSDQDGLLFRRNSQTGVVQVIQTSSKVWGGINQNLHAND